MQADCPFDVCYYGSPSGSTADADAEIDLWGFSSIGETVVYRIEGAEPFSNVSLVLALAEANAPIPGVGTVLVGQPHLATLADTANALGLANFPLAIPDDPTLLGLTLYAQGVSVGSGIELTDAVSMTVADDYGWANVPFGGVPSGPWTENDDELVWTLGPNTLTWDRSDGSFKISGAVEQEGTLFMSYDKAERRMTMDCTIVQGASSIAFVATTQSTDDALSEFHFETVFAGGESSSFDFNVATGTTTNVVMSDIDAIRALEEAIDFSAFSAMSEQIGDLMPPGSTNPLSYAREIAERGGPSLAVAGGWNFFEGALVCATSSGASAWCASAVVNGVGASCCVGAVGAAAQYAKCLNDSLF